MFENNQSSEAALYYLYMMADGEVSCSEEKVFDAICKELSIDNDTKNSIIEKCKDLTNDTSDVFSIIVREKIEEQVGRGWIGSSKASYLARTIWNLVNLGYAGSIFSEEEKRIVNYLKDKWAIDLEVYQEFVDIADTMLALTKQKEWLVSTLPNGSERDEQEKDIDTKIMQLQDDVKLTINELRM